MKKRLLVILCVVALVGVGIPVLAATPNTQETCQDSDRTTEYPNGINVWVQGTVTCPSSICQGSGTWEDSCYWSGASGWENYVLERFCFTDNKASGRTISCKSLGATCQDGRCVKLAPTPTPEPIPEPTAFRLVQFSVLWDIQGWARLGWVDGEGRFNPSTDYVRFAGPNENSLYWVDFFLKAEAYDKNVVVEVSYADKVCAGFSLAPREWPKRSGEVQWIK